MAFFEEADEQSLNDDIEEYEHPERFDLEWLVIGKQAGLSFEEMNELRLKDLRDYVNSYVDVYTGKKKRKARMATQADIDRFFA
jgi:hypothetical protein